MFNSINYITPSDDFTSEIVFNSINYVTPSDDFTSEIVFNSPRGDPG